MMLTFIVLVQMQVLRGFIETQFGCQLPRTKVKQKF